MTGLTELRRLQVARRKLGLDWTHEGPWANVGQRHPDYGMTPAEHLASKAARNQRKANQ